MSFLFPLYLLGILAVGLPVLFHLRKRPPKEKVPFGSLMFLEKSPENLTRRTRIERWLLLALRCLALVALALVFGRPFLQSTTLPAEMAAGSIKVVLVDRSASLHREDLADQALKQAKQAVAETIASDEVALVFFDRQTSTVASIEEWRNLSGRARAADFTNRVADLENSWQVSDAGRALVEAADLIAGRAAEKSYRSKEIVLISDFQEGANFDLLNQFAWPEEIEVESVMVSPRQTGNLSLTLAVAGEEQLGRQKQFHRVRVSNSTDSETDSFSLGWKGGSESKITGVVPPGSSRVLRIPVPEGDNSSGELVLTGDAHDFDNTVFVAPPRPIPLNVVFFSDEERVDQVGTPYFYLKRALHPTSTLLPSIDAAGWDSFDAQQQSDAAVLVLHGQWNGQQAKLAREMAEQGKLIVALPGAEVEKAALLELLKLPDLNIREYGGDSYAMLAGLDFDHPVLAPFARAKIRDFTKIRFWKYRQLEFASEQPPEGISVLAKFDSGSPAWVSSRTGTGAVFLFLSGWEPRESQFALSSKFVPVIYSIFENAGYSAKSAPSFYVGEIEQSGSPVERPGLYPVTGPNGEESLVAVNLHPSEGRVTQIDPQHLLKTDFGIPLTSDRKGEADSEKEKEGSNRRLVMEEKEANQKMWKWFAIAVLCFLLIETWLSGARLPRRQPA